MNREDQVEWDEAGTGQRPDPLVDAKAIAELLGVSRAYVLKLALCRKIPAYRLPPLNGTEQRTHWRFRMNEVVAWIRDRKQEWR